MNAETCNCMGAKPNSMEEAAEPDREEIKGTISLTEIE